MGVSFEQNPTPNGPRSLGELQILRCIELILKTSQFFLLVFPRCYAYFNMGMSCPALGLQHFKRYILV